MSPQFPKFAILDPDSGETVFSFKSQYWFMAQNCKEKLENMLELLLWKVFKLLKQMKDLDQPEFF